MILLNNTISYYYHLYPETIIKRKKKYIFEYHQVYYIFEPITRPLNEMEEILRLNEYSSFYNSSIGLIEKNIEGKYITILNNKYYVLISNRTPNRRIYFSDLLVVKDFIPLNNFMLLKRNDWVNLWSKKNDYFEYQKEYIKTKFPILYYSLDYYIGLSENAISYIGQVEREMKPSERDHLVLAKKRVHYNDNLHEFQSPLIIYFYSTSINRTASLCIYELAFQHGALCAGDAHIGKLPQRRFLGKLNNHIIVQTTR